MANIPDDLRYSTEHEYLKPAGEGLYYIGITDYAQGELGDVVFVELPGAGESYESGAVFGTIEAVKAVSELYAPLGLEVVEVNEALDGDPSLVNTDPYGDGWMLKVRVDDEADIDGLLDASAYASHVGED
jgi:glycine cleavage system H protein